MPSPVERAPLRVEILRSPEALARHGDAWQDLLGRSLSNQPTLSPLWLLTWWRVFGGQGGRALRACLFWDGARLVGLAPLLRRWHLPATRVPFARLELVGTGEREEDEIASDYMGVVAEIGYEEAVATSFASLVAGDALGRWDELRLTALDASAPTAALLEDALVRVGLPAQLVSDHGSPHIPLPASFDAYLAALPSTGRYFVRRSLRDFESWAKGRARYHKVERADDLAAGLRVLMSLHAERWRGAGHDGVFASPVFRAFHEAVMPELLARGALDLRWLTVDEAPIAVAYNLVWAKRVQFYQGGRAVDLPKGVRPGIALHVDAIKSAIGAGHLEYDFLAGNSQYKRQMALATRPLGRLVVERPGLRRLAHEKATELARWVRRFRDRGASSQAGSQTEESA